MNLRGDYVLYWMVAARRTSWSFALDRALAYARKLDRPLLVLEALRADYEWASDRIHAFVLQGMADNARAFAAAGITYLPYVEPAPGEGKGLVETLARRACIVITDEQPGFFIPRMVAAMASRVSVAVETVDGNGILPLRALDRAYPTAVTFRRQLQKIGYPHLLARPNPAPLARLPRSVRDADIVGRVLAKWPVAPPGLLAAHPDALARLSISHLVAPVPYAGGSRSAAAELDVFIANRLPRYAERSHPDADAASGLSPYLHFGHISPHQIVARVWDAAQWDPARIADAKATGSRQGWWGLPAESEAFLDELITWRELGYGFCFHRADHAQLAALPPWARATLAKHAADPRLVHYSRETLELARTADPVWNAAQRELLATGRIQNYLRMLWGKKIIEWSASPRAALATLIELNNKYAIDGRDPNSYSGILWCLGLFDRPWGPERPIFGTVRYMSSASTLRKLRMKQYLARWSSAQ
ncbi:MAG TPA: deoxyribodipyrimidine photolyase [Kofleriaceae bacterium]